MTNRASRNAMVGAVLAAQITLTGCGDDTATGPLKPKLLISTATYLIDASSSTVFITSEKYTDAAIKQAGGEIEALHLGDGVRVVNFGERSAENAVDVLTEKSGYNRRLPAVRKHVEATLSETMNANRRDGGQKATDLLFVLNHGNIACGPSGRLDILSDGIAEDDGYSATRELATEKPLHLPPPSSPTLLRGCSVRFIGIGMTQGIGQATQTLPEDQYNRLIAAWKAWLSNAGVSDMTFTSLL